MKTFTKEELKKITTPVGFDPYGIQNTGISYETLINNDKVLTREVAIKALLDRIHPLASKYIKINYSNNSWIHIYSDKMTLDLSYEGKNLYGQARRFYIAPFVSEFKLTKKHVESIYEVCSFIQNVISRNDYEDSSMQFLKSRLANVSITNVVLCAGSKQIVVDYGDSRAIINPSGVSTIQCRSFTINSSSEAKKYMDELASIEEFLTRAVTLVKDALGDDFFAEWRSRIK